jgi:hypothetical protein
MGAEVVDRSHKFRPQSSEVEKKEEKPAQSELTAGFLSIIQQAAKPRLKWN